MIRIIFIIAIFLVSALTSLAFGQFSGRAVYQSKTKLPELKSDKEMPDDMARQLQDRLKKQLEKTFTLEFTQSESLFKEDQRMEAPGKAPDGLMLNVIGVGGGKRYHNLQQRQIIFEDEIFGKEFLIADSLRSWDWQLVNESRKIGDYVCYKATATIKVTPEQREAYEKFKKESQSTKGRVIIHEEPKDVEVTAWYAPDIPVGHGPEEYWGLPGLILEVSNGRTTMLCSKIVLNPKEKISIEKPAKGERVSLEKFEQIRRKKIEEIQEVRQGRGDRGNVQIRIGG